MGLRLFNYIDELEFTGGDIDGHKCICHSVLESYCGTK